MQPGQRGMEGGVTLAFRGGRDGTRLVDLGQRAPLRALFPDDRATGLTTVVLVTTAGGIAGGDRLGIDIALAEAARVLVTSQAAEKVYRSLGADSRIDVRLGVGADAWLEWLPQETILFEASRLVRSTRIDLAAGARLLAGEMLVFGRRAMGERLTRGLCRDIREVHREGRLVWHDGLRLAGDIGRLLAEPAAGNGAAAVATLVYAGDDAARHLGLARHLAGAAADADAGNEAEGSAAGVRAAATLVNGLLVVRAVAAQARLLRDWLIAAWRRLRAAIAGLPAQVPRVWLT